jgi:hypothetical protein
MKQILLQGKEHPLPPQESIVLLHRSSTARSHFTELRLRNNNP